MPIMLLKADGTTVPMLKPEEFTFSVVLMDVRTHQVVRTIKEDFKTREEANKLLDKLEAKYGELLEFTYYSFQRFIREFPKQPRSPR